MGTPSLAETARLAEQARNGDLAALRELCDALNVPFLDRLPAPGLPPELAGRIELGWARKNRLVPLSTAGESVVVAVVNPLALDPVDELAFVLGRRIEVVAAPEAEVLGALNRLFSESMDTADDVLRELAETEAGHLEADLEAAQDLIDSSESAPIVRLINRVLIQAANERASDIHLESGGDRVNIRFRIDGVLYDRISPPKSYLTFLASRVKVMSGLDIAEKRLPQDGRFQFLVADRNIDVRVSVIPTSTGERVVLRLLDKSQGLLGLEDLGLEDENLRRFEDLIQKPHGIVLATGPTGSGKTTTLYAALSRLNTRDLNIITIEDPVEYQLKGVGQIHVNPKVGLDFARGLRSVLRHDPDVIMIGEIRDLETAEIAIQSSLTGHLVFSTLHTNDAPSAVTRLVDMGIEPYLVSSALIGVVAQRLVRLLCPRCKSPVTTPLAETLSRAGLAENALAGATVYKPQGCDYCHYTGYRGRTGIYELLLPTDEVQAVLATTSEAGRIRRVALAAGMTPLSESGLARVRRGQTSLEEVLRVTQT
ncbi:MAG: type II secretion system ATPase GspE [Thermodesulfobacteriota bacterium]